MTCQFNVLLKKKKSEELQYSALPQFLMMFSYSIMARRLVVVRDSSLCVCMCSCVAAASMSLHALLCYCVVLYCITCRGTAGTNYLGAIHPFWCNCIISYWNKCNKCDGQLQDVAFFLIFVLRCVLLKKQKEKKQNNFPTISKSLQSSSRTTCLSTLALTFW